MRTLPRLQGNWFIYSLDWANGCLREAVLAADGDDSYSFEGSEDHFVEDPPIPLDLIEATLTIEEKHVTTCGEELAIVPACISVKLLTPDDCSTPGLTQVIHIHARTGLILQHLRAVS